VITTLMQQVCANIETLALDEKVEALNMIRRMLHEVSPFKGEPTDCVLWAKATNVVSNAVNPNKVASQEMKLLHQSVKNYGFTMPIVTVRSSLNAMPTLGTGTHTVVDGHHRCQIVRNHKDISTRTHGYSPIVELDCSDPADLIYAMWEHNEARGKWNEELSADLVSRLNDLSEDDHRMAKGLGMEAERLIRMKAQTGIAASFAKEGFSRSWVARDANE
jgi:ParB-like chromosome segregation protein Spo0J